MKRRQMLMLLAGTGLSVSARRALGADPQKAAGEARANVVPTNPSFKPGDVRRYGMSPGATAAVNTKALQQCLDASAGQVPVTFPDDGGEYALAGRVTVPAKSTIELGRGNRLRWTATEPNGSPLLAGPTRPGLEVMGDNFKMTGSAQLIGPSVNTYVASEIGLLCVGENARALRTGFHVADGVEMLNWGSHGMAVMFTREITVASVKVHNCGYAGIQFFSCHAGQVHSNEVASITPGTEGHAYGISCTHDSRKYGDDPNAASNGRMHVHPFCSNFEVFQNTVQDIPQWTGIDFHGAWECKAHDNKVFNCRNGLLMQGSSGDGVDFGGEQNAVWNNSVTTRRMNGQPTTITEVTRLGMSINGGHKYFHRGCSVRNNTIDGYGDSKNTSFALQHQHNTGVEIAGNKITNWYGYGCYSAYADGVIRDNEFGPVADPTSSACIYIAIGGNLQILHNRHTATPGHAAMFGVYVNSPTDQPNAYDANDFRAATKQQYAGHGGGPLAPTQMKGGHT